MSASSPNTRFRPLSKEDLVADLALRSVIHECDAVQAERFHAVIIKGVVEPTLKMLREVITRGMERGEAQRDAANGYVFDAIPAMMMHRSKICASEW